MVMKLQNLSPFGISITGVSVRILEDAGVDDLKQLLANHGVVVMRCQSIDDNEFVHFLKRLGTLTFTVGEKPVPHQPWLNLVSNVERDRPPRSVFHTDTSYVTNPPAYTALKAIALPQVGGETLFSNQYRAYETLPNSVKEKLAHVSVLHAVSGIQLDPDQESEAWHPLFQRHPISGKIALFLSTPERCRSLQGFDLEEGRRLIRLLYRHSIRPYRLYRHNWQRGDIVIWDNRCTMHRADHSGAIGDRVLHRGLVSCN
jgi:taurine dioxygenase